MESGQAPSAQPAGIAGSDLPGPYGVGEYAVALRERLRAFAKVQLVGEVVNLSVSRTRVYFDLRDERGALACAVWRTDWERLAEHTTGIADGTQVVVAGGCDYYTGSAQASPAFSFGVTDLRVAGEGDLLARVERTRRALAAEGLFQPQKALPRPALPRTIGVICGRGGKARDDILAALERRGWRGRVVWAFAPVQDRHAAGAISRALTGLAGAGPIEMVIVARGGGSLTDLMAFNDETLCRTVALLRVPVISSVGHHTDHTLIDDVAAVACSTPTHAAEAAVPLDCTAQRAMLKRRAMQLRRHGAGAVVGRARVLARQTRAPRERVQRERRRLHQELRELRAASRRVLDERRRTTATRLMVLGRKRRAEAAAARGARADLLAALLRALAGHDPERTLERGYALVRDDEGRIVSSRDAARKAGRVALRFADGEISADVVTES